MKASLGEQPLGVLVWPVSRIPERLTCMGKKATEGNGGANCGYGAIWKVFMI